MFYISDYLKFIIKYSVRHHFLIDNYYFRWAVSVIKKNIITFFCLQQKFKDAIQLIEVYLLYSCTTSFSEVQRIYNIHLFQIHLFQERS